MQLVFGVCAAGAIILTINANLLGGNIGFFQSMCLLGYCLFPLDVAALVTAFVNNIIARWDCGGSLCDLVQLGFCAVHWWERATC